MNQVKIRADKNDQFILAKVDDGRRGKRVVTNYMFVSDSDPAVFDTNRSLSEGEESRILQADELTRDTWEMT